MVSVVGVKGDHQESTPRNGSRLLPCDSWFSMFTDCLVYALCCGKMGHEKKHQPLLPGACGLAKEVKQIKRVKQLQSTMIINASKEGSTVCERKGEGQGSLSEGDVSCTES